MRADRDSASFLYYVMTVRTKAKRTGRPPLDASVQKSRIVPVRFTRDEYSAIAKAAEDATITVTSWIRQHSLAPLGLAKKETNDA